MNIIIPLGGKGERFLKNGYKEPKPLIKIFEKCMIEYVLDNISIKNNKIFIIYNSKLDDSQFSHHIKQKYDFIHLIPINIDTKGATETLFLGIDHILKNHQYHNKSLILDCDTFYTEDIVEIFNESSENTVFYTKNDDEKPIYSYIELKDDYIIDIKEKAKISDNANTGAYGFVNIQSLYHYCDFVLKNNITMNNEPYTSCVISEMLKNNIIFKGYELKEENVFSLGTPTYVEKYINDTYAFLFDLDGTIVITDEIYFEVWNEILLKYNILLDKEIFTKFIQGNNDNYVLNTLLKNVNISLKELSELKDTLFLKNIDKIKLIEGIIDFIKQVKKDGHKLCIVTNCNHRVAKEIINYIHFDTFIDFFISASDCIKGKPDSEPYKKAIEKYNIRNNKCFIFEDSKTGILSGKGVEPRLIVGIETIYTREELLNYGVDICINHFRGQNLYNYILHYNKKTIENHLCKSIKYSSHNIIKNIKIDDDKLKGGFISDVISFKITTDNNITYSQILKIENTQENNLSIMAKKLDLYEREYYFYTNISNNININIPKFYNLLLDENSNNCGIVLENLIDKDYKINLNLNIESVDVTLKIIDRMAKMHSKFWNKNIKKIYPKLKNSTDEIFCPFFSTFINEKYELFKNKWFVNMNSKQQELCDTIYKDFDNIQQRFSQGNHLTFIHGDIKSPNIFYDVENNYEPIFIDWQHCAIGKGVQDLIFFIIESFDINNIKSIFNITKQYYYYKILEYGVVGYSFKEYEKDIFDAICYIPFFTSIWFGTINQDELIDKNFPFFLINKLFYLLEYVNP